jgi:nucleotidyltransferase substrate binding protein (TIGR01987 family)
MNELKTIRWQQRFQNLRKAFSQLERGLAIEHPSDIERQGIIQSFEFSFELSWKTLKDYLEAQGVTCQFPREVIKKAFHHQIIGEGELWLDMLGKRNLLAHTYDEALAMESYRLIKHDFSPELKKLVQWFQKCNEREEN